MDKVQGDAPDRWSKLQAELAECQQQRDALAEENRVLTEALKEMHYQFKDSVKFTEQRQIVDYVGKKFL